MPIRPENKSRYPANWKEIREQILQRAQNKCEGCSLENHEYVLRSNKSDWFIQATSKGQALNTKGFEEMFPDHRRVKVVLTIAHLDHVPENCDPSNLKAWCQACHNQYDAPMRAAGRRARRKANAI